MGIISKIEDKLSGNGSSKEDSTVAADQPEYRQRDQYGSKEGMGHDTHRDAHHGTQYDNSHGREKQGLSHDQSQSNSSALGDTRDTPSHATSTSIRHPVGSGTKESGITGGIYKDGMPMNASTGAAGGSTAGVTQGMHDLSLKKGPHPELENRDAVPTAGGVKVGGLGGETVGSGYNTSGSGHNTSGSGHTTSSSVPGAFDSYDSVGAAHDHQRAGQQTSSSGTVTYDPRDSHGLASRQHEQHHSGHNTSVPAAAVATTAAVGGAGSYEASKNRDSAYTGPASNTIGPHKSNLANIADPRVQPDPALQGSSKPSAATGPASKTSGPYDSNVVNTVNSRAGPNSDLQGSTLTSDHGHNPRAGNAHHYGRDAALAGSVGGVGVAGAHAEHQHKKHDSHHDGQPVTSTMHSGNKDSVLEHHTHTTPKSITAPYGQNISYMNRPAPDEPLSQSKDFTERHPVATTTGAAGVGAGFGSGLGSAATSTGHREQGQFGAQGHSGAGITGTNTSSAGGAGAPYGSKQLASAYEAGYEAGFRDGAAKR